MKCNPWRWLWGLVPILMLGWIAVLGERERIEADLTSRTRTVLERSGYDWADVSFDGRDAVISGRADDESEPAKAVAAVLDTMGVRNVDNRASLIDKAERYEWSAIRRDDRIRVDGLVPSDRSRRDVIGMVKANFPSLDVDDRMKLARGEPPLDVWLGGVGFGLRQLALLSQGRVDLESTSLSVSGEALDQRSYRAIKSALAGQVPQGIRVARAAVKPPAASPFTWSVRRQGNEVVLAGHVPNDKVKLELERAARGVAPEAKVVDRMEPASGEPEEFASIATALVAQLARLEEGTAQLRDGSAWLNGTAESATRAAEVKSAMGAGVLASFRTTGEIRHREPQMKTISPYETAAEVSSSLIVLSGYVPDEKARAALLAMARRRFEGRQLRDELQLGSGEPPGWELCLEVAFDALQSLGNGRAGLLGTRLSIAGSTDAEVLAQSLPEQVRARAGSSCETDIQVTLETTAAEARESARRRAAAEAEQLADAERRREEAARRDEERRRAEEAARLQAEAERKRAAEAERRRAEEAERLRAEEEARRVAEEKRRRAEEAARIRAEEDARRRQAEEEARRLAEQAERERAAEEARRQAEAAERARAEAEARARAEAAAGQESAKGEQERATAEQRARKQVADTCQEALSRVAREGVINFKRASFDLDPSSYPTLNKVAAAANECPSIVVEIEGHTDSEGTPERNQRLSDRRANAVKQYLSRAGVDESRLLAVGYGQDRNIDTNDTPEGRAKNRRIEFVVKMR